MVADEIVGVVGILERVDQGSARCQRRLWDPNACHVRQLVVLNEEEIWWR